MAIALSVPIMLIWLTAEERFPFSRNLQVETADPNHPVPDICVACFNLTDSGKLITSIYLQMDYPEPNSTDVSLQIRIQHQSETEIDSLTLVFSQYGYQGVSGSLDQTSTVPQDKFASSNANEAWELTTNDLSNYGVENVTLTFTLNLRPSYRVFEYVQYDVDLGIILSMHERTLIQLISLNASMGLHGPSGFYVRPP